MAEYGFTSMPPGGSDAVMIYIGGDRSAGIIVTTGNHDARMRNLVAGEVAIHDDQGHSLYDPRRNRREWRGSTVDDDEQHSCH